MKAGNYSIANVTYQLLRIFSICFLITVSNVLSKGQASRINEPELKSLFVDVAFNPEFGEQNSRIKKWAENVRVFIKNPEQTLLVEEFEKIREEINKLTSSVQMERVEDESEANFIIFFSRQNEYARFEPNAKSYLAGNFGFFWTYWNSKNEITRASMYVDIFRTKDASCQKHLLREELTQAMGLMNDTDRYESSIFYSRWTCTSTYSKRDEEVLRLFLSKEIKPGMSLGQVKKLLGWK